MEENRKNEQEIQKLDLEKMEQVSGGNRNPPNKKYCNNCKETTTWVNVNGVWVCGKCACGTGSPIIL